MWTSDRSVSWSKEGDIEASDVVCLIEDHRKEGEFFRLTRSGGWGGLIARSSEDVESMERFRRFWVYSGCTDGTQRQTVIILERQVFGVCMEGSRSWSMGKFR